MSPLEGPAFCGASKTSRTASSPVSTSHPSPIIRADISENGFQLPGCDRPGSSRCTLAHLNWDCRKHPEVLRTVLSYTFFGINISTHSDEQTLCFTEWMNHEWFKRQANRLRSHQRMQPNAQIYKVLVGSSSPTFSFMRLHRH